jgi:hypothetical protein
MKCISNEGRKPLSRNDRRRYLLLLRHRIRHCRVQLLDEITETSKAFRELRARGGRISWRGGDSSQTGAKRMAARRCLTKTFAIVRARNIVSVGSHRA